jgi:hypothetical protein
MKSPKFPIVLGITVTLILFVKNYLLYHFYSYTFLPDSNLYVALGASLFKTWAISPIVTFPFIFLNALTASSQAPTLLLGLQMMLSALSGGVLCTIVARKDKPLAVVLAGLFALDLVWGAFSRSILTDGLFASFNLFSLALLLSHYDRRGQVGTAELILSGVLYGWTLFYRPSNLFLIVFFPFIYIGLTRSWKKTAALMCGFLIFFSGIGLINWKGSGNFYILAGGNSYTGSQTAFPLLVYRLYSPDNGPASQKIHQALQACSPDKDLTAGVDRSASGAFDSVNNMNLINHQIIPCIDQNPRGSALFPAAYIEAFASHPVSFAFTMLREDAVFLRYNNPYILRWLLSPSKNYGCSNISWCADVTQQTGRSDWTGTGASNLYEKSATKLIQAYLWPIGSITRVIPDNQTAPYWIAWFGMGLFLLLAGRGRTRFLALAGFVLIQYTSLVVVAGLGFTERYAAMLSPIQGVLSAITYLLLARLLWQGIQRLRGLKKEA